MRFMLAASFGDTGIEAALRYLASLSAFRNPPEEAELDFKPLAALVNWSTKLARSTKQGSAVWPPPRDPDGMAISILVKMRAIPPRVQIQIPAWFETFDEGIRQIEALPFHIASTGACSEDLLHAWAKMRLEPHDFGVGHYHFGWACAFRGPGHERLVSRRCLDFGPFRVIHLPDDLTIVQFHDLAAASDPKLAAEQALPGWKWLDKIRGGFLPAPYMFNHDVKGLYHADTQKLEIVVPPGGKVEPWQMNDACAIRVRHGVAPPTEKPIAQVAYVFVDEADARAHLHELWLRELEVWLVDGKGHRRLDDAYHPQPPPPPTWVAALPPITG